MNSWGEPVLHDIAICAIAMRKLDRAPRRIYLHSKLQNVFHSIVQINFFYFKMYFHYCKMYLPKSNNYSNEETG